MKKNFDYLKDETLQKLAKYGMLSLFIKNQILDREMKKISLSEIEITEAKNLYKKSHKLESDEDFEHHKQIRFYTDESIRFNIELPFKQYKFCKEMFGESLYTNYLKYKSFFDIVTYSIIRVDSESKSKEIYLQLKDDKRVFSELVNKYSQGPERKSQGIIGPIRLNQGHPLLQKQIIQNKDLCFSQPFKIDSKWIIIKVENFIESKLDDFVEKEIYKIELENFLKEEIKKYLE
tara:strand:+ start:835 stop:1536 length:702 start_codon:yes stop_codon:yes gene_type:complete